MKRLVGPILTALLLGGLLPAQALAAAGPDFVVQPGGGQAGVAWAQQPSVAIKSGKIVDTAATGTITLSIRPGNEDAGILTCASNTVAVVNGVAAFSGCSINVAGTFRLRAAWSAGGTADSNAFTITGAGGAGTKLGFLSQPARGTPNAAFAVQPTVAVQNAGGSTVTNVAPTVITLALGANPSGAVLTCTGGLSQATSNGIATFNGCRLDKVGVGYTMVATATALTSATSALFDVADRLVFTTQPAGAVGGVAFTTQPVVAVRAGASATASHDNGTVVTLSIKAGTGATGAVLSCSGGNTRTAVAGVATFSGCVIDKASPTSPANPYVLVATATGLASAESTSLTVAAGPASKLMFSIQPVGANAGQPFATQPTVAITDAGGNIVTTGASSTLTVTLALGANPGGGVLTCTGGLSKPAVAGLAAFTGCSINKPGVGYTLVASASGLTSATSNPFNIGSGSALTITTSSSVITWGSQIVLTARIDQLGANRQVQLQGSRTGSSWTTIATLFTNASGNVSYLYTPVTNLYYRAVFAGAADLPAMTSATTRTVVRQVSVLRSIYRGLVVRVAVGGGVTFTDTVRPARPELPKATVRFVFYRRGGDGIWRLYDQRDVVIDSLGRAATTWTFPMAGEWYVRSQARPTPYNANSVWSSLHRFSVR
jgi:hypothetical protein